MKSIALRIEIKGSIQGCNDVVNTVSSEVDSISIDSFEFWISSVLSGLAAQGFSLNWGDIQTQMNLSVRNRLGSMLAINMTEIFSYKQSGTFIRLLIKTYC